MNPLHPIVVDHARTHHGYLGDSYREACDVIAALCEGPHVTPPQPVAPGAGLDLVDAAGASRVRITQRGSRRRYRRTLDEYALRWDG